MAIVGLGWFGSVLAYELACTGLEGVAVERGPWRDTATDFDIRTAPDEPRYGVLCDAFPAPGARDLFLQERNQMQDWPVSYDDLESH
ncbi:choline dehydrogenase-like flavoprotein [Bradyrhizobium sp. USDA 4341]